MVNLLLRNRVADFIKKWKDLSYRKKFWKTSNTYEINGPYPSPKYKKTHQEDQAMI